VAADHNRHYKAGRCPAHLLCGLLAAATVVLRRIVIVYFIYPICQWAWSIKAPPSLSRFIENGRAIVNVEMVSFSSGSARRRCHLSSVALQTDAMLLYSIKPLHAVAAAAPLAVDYGTILLAVVS